MSNWISYFKEKLLTNGLYFLYKEDTDGDIDFLIFKPNDSANETTIEIGILKNGDLLALEFINPKTPGFTKQQQEEFFYKCSYKSYGVSGVEFNTGNVNHFEKFLKKGLRGREVQYIKNGKIIQSDIFQYYGTEMSPYGISITLGRLSFIERLKTLFLRDKFYDTKQEVELSQVFSGI